MRQQFGGIGVRIRILGDPPELVVVGAPDPGTPAARADIRANDRVLEIDGKSTTGMNMTEVLHLMRGQPGEPLRLLIRHADAAHPEVKELVREVITVDSILGDRRTAEGGWEFRLEADPRIAQVRVTTFGNKTAEELDRVLTRLTDEGVEAVVLDLRDDAGGSLDAAVAICDMFLPAGKKIVEIRGRDDVLEERYLSSGSGKFAKLPLAVLVNAGSASASEIRRRLLAGQRSSRSARRAQLWQGNRAEIDPDRVGSELAQADVRALPPPQRQEHPPHGRRQGLATTGACRPIRATRCRSPTKSSKPTQNTAAPATCGAIRRRRNCCRPRMQ